MSLRRSAPKPGPAKTAFPSPQAEKTRADMRQPKRKSDDFQPEAASNQLIILGYFRTGGVPKLPKLTTRVRFPSPAPNKINELAADLERK